MATQTLRERAHTSSAEMFTLRWRSAPPTADVWQPHQGEDETNLNIEDFKCVDREHQAIYHFMFLWSKGT